MLGITVAPTSAAEGTVKGCLKLVGVPEAVAGEDVIAERSPPVTGAIDVVDAV